MNNELASNSQAHGFKDYEYPVRKVPGVFRIFVLGDSLAFGQGVQVDQTFSKVLEGMLNRRSSSTVYEVINSSVPGMNAILEHCLQKTLGTDYEPDLYLLALCVNDPELHQPEDNSDYPGHVRRIWDRQGDTWPYFEEALRRLKSTAEAHETKLAAAYFVFGDQSVGPEAPGILAETCRALEIPFTDTGESTGQYESSRLWVNPVENHPNAFAHRIYAQHLLQFLDAQGFLPPEDPGADERDLLRGFLDSSLGEVRVLRSESLTLPLARLTALLLTKLERRSFGPQEAPNRIEKQELEGALNYLSPLLRRAQFLECLEGYDTNLRAACIEGPVPLFTIGQTTQELQVSLYYLTMFHRLRSLLPEMIPQADEAPQPPDLDSFNAARRDLDELLPAAGSLTRDLERCFAEALRPFEAVPETDCFLAPELAKVAARLTGAATRGSRPIGLFWAEALRIGRTLQTIGQELAAELETFRSLGEADFPDPDQFRRYRHFVSETVQSFYQQVAHLSYRLHEQNLDGLRMTASKLAEGSALPWEGQSVEVEVTILGTPRDDYSHLGVLWSDVVPLAAPKRDTMAIETDGGVHSYRYKFNAGVMGYFTVELLNCEPSQLRSIRLHMNGRPVREWAGPDLQRVIDCQLRSELFVLNDAR